MKNIGLCKEVILEELLVCRMRETEVAAETLGLEWKNDEHVIRTESSEGAEANWPWPPSLT